MFLKLIAAAIVMALIASSSAENAIYGAINIYSGLLAVIATGIFGLIWKEEADMSNFHANASVIGIAFVAFITAFVLSEYLLIGAERINAILLSFIAVGVLGLVIIKRK